MEYFRAFITKDFRSMLCVETNGYAEKFLSGAARPATKLARFQVWKPVVSEKMKVL
jgi:hypothetical protein